MGPRTTRTSPSSTTAPAQPPDLPEAVIACILQHVPVRQRMTSCVLVCHLWAAAASAMPMWDVQLKRSKHCGQLQDWLAKHGGVVAALAAKGDEWGSWRNWRPLQLPILQLNQLRSLDLSRLRVQLPAHSIPAPSTPPSRARTLRTSSIVTRSSSGAGSAVPTAAAVLPQLRELSLSHCQLPAQLALQLLSTTTLSVIRWQFVELYDEDGTEQLAQKQVLSSLWQQLQLLPTLSELQLHEEGLAAADIAPLSNLQRLQHLKLQLSLDSGEGEPGPSGLLAALSAALR